LGDANVVEVSVDEDGQTLYSVPSSRRAQMKEMGGIFETLILRPLDVETTFNMVQYRAQKVLDKDMPPEGLSQAA